MILNVPFYKQENKYDCGPTAVQMVLEYLGGKPYSRDKLQELIDSDKSGVTWTIGIARTAANFGFPTELYSISLGFNPKNYDLEFYQKLADEASSTKSKIERLTVEAIKLGVKMEERSFSLEEILNMINENCIPIILLDWSKIKGSGNFTGHFVPIVGYDDKNVYVHNQGSLNPQGNLAISREIFDVARKAKGTDEDIVFISRGR